MPIVYDNRTMIYEVRSAVTTENLAKMSFTITDDTQRYLFHQKRKNYHTRNALNHTFSYKINQYIAKQYSLLHSYMI